MQICKYLFVFKYAINNKITYLKWLKRKYI